MNGNDTVVTKDYWIIIMLRSKGFQELSIDEHKKDGGQYEMIYTFGEDAIPTYQDYMAGKPIMVDLHDVEREANLFKKSLHARN